MKVHYDLLGCFRSQNGNFAANKIHEAARKSKYMKEFLLLCADIAGIQRKQMNSLRPLWVILAKVLACLSISAAIWARLNVLKQIYRNL